MTQKIFNVYPVYISSYSGTQETVNITLMPGDETIQGSVSQPSGAYDIVISSPDNINTFLTKEDAAYYLYSNGSPSNADSMLASANSVAGGGSPSPYIAGSLNQLPDKEMNQLITKQPLNSNLTQLAGITGPLSTGVITLMTAPDIATVKTDMAFGISDISGLSSALSGKVATSVTINGHVLSSNITITKSDISLGSVVNTDTTTTANITDSTNKRFVTDSQLTNINALPQTSVSGNAGTATKLQTARTINGISFDGTSNITIPGTAYQGITQRLGAFPIFKSATASSGVAIFYLTNDGTSTGTSLFPNGIIDESVNLFVSDSTASFQMSYAMSNSNKTLTVTVNKLTTANILTGILGQASGNGSVVKLTVWGY